MSKIIKYQQGAKTPFNAQNGTTLTGPTIRGKRYPEGTIVTNDPELYQRNQDSLRLYNRYKQREAAINKYGGWNTVDELNSFRKALGEPISLFERKVENNIPIRSILTKYINGEKPIRRNYELNIYEEPTNMIYQPNITKMTPKGLPTSTQPTPKLLRMPDRIELDPTKHAAYRGIDVSHYTDGLGRYTAKLNLVTKPGVTGRISYKQGGILKAQSGGIIKYQNSGKFKLPTLPIHANTQATQDNVVRQYNPVTNPDERYISEEEARKLRVAKREKELQEYYSQPGMVSGMKRKPTPSEVKAHAKSSVSYNDRVKNDPVGTFGPDFALSFIPELLMFKGPQQVISKGLNKMNPFKSYNPWRKEALDQSALVTELRKELAKNGIVQSQKTLNTP